MPGKHCPTEVPLVQGGIKKDRAKKHCEKVKKGGKKGPRSRKRKGQTRRRASGNQITTTRESREKRKKSRKGGPSIKKKERIKIGGTNPKPTEEEKVA